MLVAIASYVCISDCHADCSCQSYLRPDLRDGMSGDGWRKSGVGHLVKECTIFPIDFWVIELCSWCLMAGELVFLSSECSLSLSISPSLSLPLALCLCLCPCVCHFLLRVLGLIEITSCEPSADPSVFAKVDETYRKVFVRELFLIVLRQIPGALLLYCVCSLFRNVNFLY